MVESDAAKRSSAAGGAAGGFLATVPMTATMSILHRRLPRHLRYPLPPRLMVERFTPTEDAARLMTEFAHYGYGAATGALHPWFAARWGDAGAVGDAAFGVLVWAGSYLGWIPAVGLLPPATRHPKSRVALMIAAHVVWGVATGWTARQMGTRTRPRTDRGAAVALAAGLGGLALVLALDGIPRHREPFARKRPRASADGRFPAH